VGAACGLDKGVGKAWNRGYKPLPHKRKKEVTKMFRKELLRFEFLNGAPDTPSSMVPSSKGGILLKRKSSGFTLVELMVVIGMVVVLFSLAVPSFTAMIENTKVTIQTNELVSAFNLARSEAIKRGVRVTVCKSANGTACTNAGDWAQGWIVFEDTDNDATVDVAPAEDILRVRGAIRINGELDTSLTLAGAGDVANYVSYLGDGASYTTAGALQSGTISLRSRGPGIDIQLLAGRVRSESAT
jgi:type IV fimbrial biogenesis protein FimT